LDSVIADIRIRILTGGYPFTPRGQKNLLIENFHPVYYRDSLAMLVIDKDITIEDAHYRLADRCYAAKDYTAFEKELLVLIADREINPTHYRKLCKGFIDAGMYDRAMPYLKKLDAISSDAYSNKWIGAIYLQSGNSRDAQIYLERSAALEADDPQVWYNLSGAYYNNGNVNKSLDAIKQCLRVNPRYQSARDFYFQLRRAYGVQ
jgi:predicted Zn-dependent protease